MWICRPNASNITAIFRVLTKLASDIESKLQTEGAPCQLRSFLHKFVADTFMQRIEVELQEKADAVLQATDAWTSLVNRDNNNRSSTTTPVSADW